MALEAYNHVAGESFDPGDFSRWRDLWASGGCRPLGAWASTNLYSLELSYN